LSINGKISNDIFVVGSHFTPLQQAKIATKKFLLQFSPYKRSKQGGRILNSKKFILAFLTVESQGSRKSRIKTKTLKLRSVGHICLNFQEKMV
jgi:hypothetical protein